jgi:hypothetical protein
MKLPFIAVNVLITVNTVRSLSAVRMPWFAMSPSRVVQINH